MRNNSNMRNIMFVCTLILLVCSCSEDKPQLTEVSQSEFQEFATNKVWQAPVKPDFFNGSGMERPDISWAGEISEKGLYITESEICIFNDSHLLRTTWVEHYPYKYDEMTGVLTASGNLSSYGTLKRNTMYIESVSDEELILCADYGCLTKAYSVFPKLPYSDPRFKETDSLSYARYVYKRVPETEEEDWWSNYRH